MRKSRSLELTLPPSAPMLRAVGLVAVQWGYLEYEIDQELKALIQEPQNAEEKFSFQFPFRKRARAWRRFARKSYDADLIASVENISSRASTIKPQRDAVVHGVYSSGRGEMSLQTFRHADLVDYRPITLDGIKETARQISEIGAAMLRHHIAVTRRYAVEPPAPDPELIGSKRPHRTHR